VKRKFAITSLLVAWICANGALLDVMQMVAWGKMFSVYAKSMSLSSALKETFDPAKPCEMCVGVAAAKEDLGQKKLPVTIEPHDQKLVLAFDVPPMFVLVGMPESWPAEPAMAAPSRNELVPVPPPRV
jgi:hypothetical protein